MAESTIRGVHQRCPLALSVATWLLLMTAIVLRVTSNDYGQEVPKRGAASAPDESAKEKQAAAATPLDVYRSYLVAVKKNDLAGAKQCWCMSGKGSAEALDTIAGIWVAYHRFNGAMAKFGEHGKHFIRDDCTDQAIDQTLARLEHSQVSVIGETAKLSIRWAKGDGYPNPVFGYRDAPILFRKTSAGWRIDANAECAMDKPEDFFAKESWGLAIRTQAAMMNEIASGVESGKTKSIGDVISAMEKHVGSLEGRTALTKPILYEEDSPKRYLRIRKGNPGIGSVGPADLPHRKDIKSPTQVEGNVEFVFENIYHHRKIVVETTNKKGYEVVFGYDDKDALEIVAKQLGMTVGKEDREILTIVLDVRPGGHRLKQVKKRETPQWQWTYTDRGRAYHGVTMDELAQFLEDLFNQPVVDKTGLAGYYWLELSGDAERVPQQGETKPLDQTGLQLHWERTKTKILVVKDK